MHAEKQTVPVARKHRLLLWKVKAAADTGGKIQINQQDEEVVCKPYLSHCSPVCVCARASAYRLTLC